MVINIVIYLIYVFYGQVNPVKLTLVSPDTKVKQFGDTGSGSNR